MFGLIGAIHTTVEGRGEVVDALLTVRGTMPGNREYLVALDAQDDTAIWVTEVWDSQDAHAASLLLPVVTDAIARARPHITGMGSRIVTTPIGLDKATP